MEFGRKIQFEKAGIEGTLVLHDRLRGNSGLLYLALVGGRVAIECPPTQALIRAKRLAVRMN